MRRSLPLAHAPGLSVWTNSLGEYALLDDQTSELLHRDALSPDHPRNFDVCARGLDRALGPAGGLADTVRRTRKGFLLEGPTLHIFVVTLRCDHSCQYCQVSRAALNAPGFDMSFEHASLAVERVFETDADALTIEFQGGEPSLRFDIVRHIVALAETKAQETGMRVRFTMATTLHLLSDADLDFCRAHALHLSTSFDGPEFLHARQRRLPGENAWKRTIEGLRRARAVLGHDGVVALPTITKPALQHPVEIVDAYVEFGFKSIFLRPLAILGFAKRTQRSLGYTMQDFLAFYEVALAHILDLNADGVEIEETNAAIALRHILTPFHSGYMDLRSPAGAGLGTLVYNYDGKVYPSDEGRMAAEGGDTRFALGSVAEPLDALLTSDAMRWLASGAVAETNPDCADCAFVPYCGADPVFHAVTQGAPNAPRHGTAFCDRNMGIFQILFARLAERDPETMRTFASWAFKRPRGDAHPGWIEQ